MFVYLEENSDPRSQMVAFLYSTLTYLDKILRKAEPKNLRPDSKEDTRWLTEDMDTDEDTVDTDDLDIDHSDDFDAEDIEDFTRQVDIIKGKRA